MVTLRPSADLTASEAEDEIRAAVETAANLLVPYVALHTVCDDRQTVIEKLSPLVALAEKNNVTLLLESGGAMANTKKLVEVLDYFACDHLAACWNAHSGTCRRRSGSGSSPRHPAPPSRRGPIAGTRTRRS